MILHDAYLLSLFQFLSFFYLQLLQHCIGDCILFGDILHIIIESYIGLIFYSNCQPFLLFMLFIDLYLFRLRHDPLDGTRSYRYDRLSSSL